MASDSKKKKIQSLQESISRLTSQMALAKTAGNKVQADSISKILIRLEVDLLALKRN